jgi:hypothetical protein
MLEIYLARQDENYPVEVDTTISVFAVRDLMQTKQMVLHRERRNKLFIEK